MWMRRLIFFMSIYFFGVSCVYAQSKYVVRIKASNCNYNSERGATNFSTGSIVKYDRKVVGVLTTLHGVCGCKTISIEDSNGKDFFNLTITQADIKNDIALLSSNELLSYYKDGLLLSNQSASSLANQNVEMVAYPYGIKLSLDTKMMRVRESPSPLVKLNKFLKSSVEIALRKRGSPNVYIDVLNLEAEIVPGCSGAPIIYEGEIIGIANGGLDGGRTHVCWAIPVENIELTNISSLGGAYKALLTLNPNELFVLTCRLETNEDRSTDEDNYSSKRKELKVTTISFRTLEELKKKFSTRGAIPSQIVRWTEPGCQVKATISINYENLKLNEEANSFTVPFRYYTRNAEYNCGGSWNPGRNTSSPGILSADLLYKNGIIEITNPKVGLENSYKPVSLQVLEIFQGYLN